MRSAVAAVYGVRCFAEFSMTWVGLMDVIYGTKQ